MPGCASNAGKGVAARRDPGPTLRARRTNLRPACNTRKMRGMTWLVGALQLSACLDLGRRSPRAPAPRRAISSTSIPSARTAARRPALPRHRLPALPRARLTSRARRAELECAELECAELECAELAIVCRSRGEHHDRDTSGHYGLADDHDADGDHDPDGDHREHRRQPDIAVHRRECVAGRRAGLGAGRIGARPSAPPAKRVVPPAEASVAINARAAVRMQIGGVERLAREMALRLPALAPDRYRVIRPPAALAHRAGHLWEQAALPVESQIIPDSLALASVERSR